MLETKAGPKLSLPLPKSIFTTGSPKLPEQICENTFSGKVILQYKRTIYKILHFNNLQYCTTFKSFFLNPVESKYKIHESVLDIIHSFVVFYGVKQRIDISFCIAKTL